MYAVDDLSYLLHKAILQGVVVARIRRIRKRRKERTAAMRWMKGREGRMWDGLTGDSRVGGVDVVDSGNWEGWERA